MIDRKIGDYIITEKPDKNKWNEFVLQHNSGNIFQTSWMYEVYKNTELNDAGVIALETKKGEVLGILVYAILFEPGIKSKFTIRSIISGGPIIKDNNPDYAKIILDFYIKKTQSTDAIYTEVRNLFDISYLHPCFEKAGFQYIEHLTIHNDLTQSIEQMTEATHRGRWSNIKRSIKKGVKVKQLTSLEDIRRGHELIKEIYLRINLPAPHEDLFINTGKYLKDHCYIAGAFLDDKLIGCRVYLLCRTIMYDWYAAIDKEYSNYSVADLMPWQMMLWGKENGFTIYDFAGAGKPEQAYSVRDYKLKFGGQLLSFGRYIITHKPLMYNLGKAGLKFYKYVR